MRKPPTTERGRRAAERWERWRQERKAEQAHREREQLEREGQTTLDLEDPELAPPGRPVAELENGMTLYARADPEGDADPLAEFFD